MVITVCLILLGAVLLFCGWAFCRAAGAITEHEIQPPDPEQRIVPIRPEVNRTPWKDAAHTIVLSAEQQAELMHIDCEEYVLRLPEMPVRCFLDIVKMQQRPDKPIEVEVMFAQRHALRAFCEEHGLDWLRYAIDRSVAKEQLT